MIKPRRLFLGTCLLLFFVLVARFWMLEDRTESDFTEFEHRISLLEKTLSDSNPSDLAISRAGDHGPRNPQHSRSFPQQAALPCPVMLGYLKSIESMRSVGWEFDLTTQQAGDAAGGHFWGWKDGWEKGSVKVRFNVSGVMYLRLRNDHESGAPENVVTASLRNEYYREPLAVLTSGKEAHLCIPFQPGDELQIAEHFGKIRILGVSVFCPAFIRTFAVPPSSSRACAKDEVVFVQKLNCFKQEWVRGRLDKILDGERAVVRLDTPPLDGVASVWQVHSANRLWLDGHPAAGRCSSFEMKRDRVGIVQVADAQHAERFKLYFKAQRCYARDRGYDFVMLDIRSWPQCHKYSFWGASMFFEKHCVVRAFLMLQEPNYIAVVIDTDVIPAVLGRGFEDWLGIDSDVQFYERLWKDEIAAGNYIVRNTPFGRKFLYEWSERAFKLPPGYSSYDNGAVHVFLLELLELEGRERCIALYNNLHVDMVKWATNADVGPYTEFVTCAKALLGPPRTWDLPDGRVTIWPRGGHFVVDGRYLDSKGSIYFGPVLHHGLKEKTEIDLYFSNLDECRLNESQYMDREEYGRMASQYIIAMAKGYVGGPVCYQCTEECLLEFSCAPLASEAEPRPRRGSSWLAGFLT